MLNITRCITPKLQRVESLTGITGQNSNNFQSVLHLRCKKNGLTQKPFTFSRLPSAIFSHTRKNKNTTDDSNKSNRLTGPLPLPPPPLPAPPKPPPHPSPPPPRACACHRGWWALPQRPPPPPSFFPPLAVPVSPRCGSHNVVMYVVPGYTAVDGMVSGQKGEVGAE